MSANLNSIYSSFINNISSTHKSSTKRTVTNSKDIGNALFATQVENEKKTDTYINEIKNCVPETTVTIKSMNAGDVQKYYQEWKNQSTDYSEFKHNITVSPKVLEKMEKDPKYAEQMLQKIKKAATPEGFENATLYEYKVIVRDDGEIETLACADFMNGKSEKIENNDDDKKKAEKKRAERKKAENERVEKNELKNIYANRRIYDQWKSQTLSEEKIKINQFIKQQYLSHTGVVKKIGNGNEVFDLT